MNWIETKRIFSKPVFSILCGMLPALVVADDTEIYFTDLPEGQGVANVLFILDHSGSMAKSPLGDALEGGAENGASRYQIMRRVFDNVLNDLPKSLSAGLMTYGGHNLPAEANGVKYPVSLLDDVQRAGLADTLDGFEVAGYTPIVQSLYEAALYFKGNNADYGSSAETVQEAHPGSLDSAGSSVTEETNTVTDQCYFGSHCDQKAAEGATVAKICTTYDPTKGGTFTGDGDICLVKLDEAGNCSEWNQVQITVDPLPERTLCDYTQEVTTYTPNYKYKSPIGSECQPNYIILLSDGEPNDGEVDRDLEIENKVVLFKGSACTGVQSDGYCGPDLTNYLANTDLRDDLDDDQTVKTYAIGFANTGTGNKYLESIANLGSEAEAAGDQGFFAADDEHRLQQAFNEIIDDIAGQTSSLLPPTFSLDDATGLETGNQVFLPFFRPSFLPRWSGNLKRYKREGTTLVDENDANVVLDGKINPAAQSAWSEKPDGDSVRKGGAASLLGISRNLLTENATGNLVATGAGTASAAAMGLQGDDAGLHDEILQFAKGIEPGGELARSAMGDILHSRPLLVSYGKEAAKKVVFTSTNEGYLHAFNADSGEELFAFMPQAVLPILPRLYENDPDDSHPYGMDGPITVWRNDANGDGAIEGGDHVYLYAGMRRGGNNYYALDVTNPSAPKLKWIIEGGVGKYSLLGQSWSKPVAAQVELKRGDEPKDVLFFGGGYDEKHDELSCDLDDTSTSECPKASLKREEPTGRETDDLGGKVFMVDAKTGELLWSAGSDHQSSVQVDSMTNAIAADLSVVDLDGNGVVDRVYAADLGGRIFRMDFPDSTNTQMDDNEELVHPRAQLFADLGGASVSDNRRFFYAPDVSISREGIRRFVAISIGSGYRAHPLDKGEGVAAKNRIYVLKDYALTSTLENNFVPLTNASLYNATTVQKSKTANGWYIDLNQASGEKVLARAVSLNNAVYFTSFTPSEPPEDIQCTPATHKASIYTLDLKTGGSAIPFKDGEDEEIRVRHVVTGDILPEVSLVFSKGKGADGAVVVQVMAGTGLMAEEVGGGTLPGLLKVYWEEER